MSHIRQIIREIISNADQKESVDDFRPRLEKIANILPIETYINKWYYVSGEGNYPTQELAWKIALNGAWEGMNPEIIEVLSLTSRPNSDLAEHMILFIAQSHTKKNNSLNMGTVEYYTGDYHQQAEGSEVSYYLTIESSKTEYLDLDPAIIKSVENIISRDDAILKSTAVDIDLD